MRAIRTAVMLNASLVAAGALAGAALANDGGARVVVRFKHDAPAVERASALREAGATSPRGRVGGAVVAGLRAKVSARAAVRRLRRARAVAWTDRALAAQPAFVPNDTGVASASGPPSGWAGVQWALNGPFGIRASEGWSHASRRGGSGGRDVTIAVLDSGVAYADRGPYRRSPDLAAARFVRGYDFVYHDPYPNDDYGHGTFVASTIAATANNAYGTVGVAYRARIMPVQVLDTSGRGDNITIARGIRYAVDRGADVINLSLELADTVAQRIVHRSLTASPVIRAALREARAHGVVVVAAAGNTFELHVPGARYDALSIEVGGTTEHGCLGNYSNHGPGVDIVAPGGGSDAPLAGDPDCQAQVPAGRDIAAVSFQAQSPLRFEIPPGRYGTSFAAPHVTGVVALVLASRVLGEHPTPDRVEALLERTARDLGAPGRDRYYGAGLLDAAAAIAGAPGAVTPSG